MLRKFIQIVTEARERKGKRAVIDIEIATAVSDFIEQTLDARSKGGRNRHVNTELSTDPAAIKTRERVARFRERKRKEKP